VVVVHVVVKPVILQMPLQLRGLGNTAFTCLPKVLVGCLEWRGRKHVRTIITYLWSNPAEAMSRGNALFFTCGFVTMYGFDGRMYSESH